MAATETSSNDTTLQRAIEEIAVRAKLDNVLGKPQTATAEFARDLTTAKLFKRMTDAEITKIAASI